MGDSTRHRVPSGHPVTGGITSFPLDIEGRAVESSRISRRVLVSGALGSLAASAVGAAGEKTARMSDSNTPFHRAELIFPLDYLHNHGSCMVECPNGDLLACWYRGSGERRSDDVRVLGARRRKGESGWSEPFVMADSPGFPDCNPCLFFDPKGRLWLFWPLIIANEWHTALLMSRMAERWDRSGAPQWVREKPIILKPGEEFTKAVHATVEQDLKRVESFPVELQERARAYLELRRKNAADKYFCRMGWMPRVHPILVGEKRIVLPLYSDGFDFSLMAISDDLGETWRPSLPLVGDGPVQPALVQKRDGTLVAYMRDNGGPPQRVQTSESRDGGETWSPVRDTELLNPGAGVDVVGLKNGHWVMANNDTEKGRHSLLLSISEDEGKTWRWNRHLELDRTVETPNTFAYPSLVPGADGSVHISYTYTTGPRDSKKDAEGRVLRECIKHAQFNEAWVRAGD